MKWFHWMTEEVEEREQYEPNKEKIIDEYGLTAHLCIHLFTLCDTFWISILNLISFDYFILPSVVHCAAIWPSTNFSLSFSYSVDNGNRHFCSPFHVRTKSSNGSSSSSIFNFKWLYRWIDWNNWNVQTIESYHNSVWRTLVENEYSLKCDTSNNDESTLLCTIHCVCVCARAHTHTNTETSAIESTHSQQHSIGVRLYVYRKLSKWAAPRFYIVRCGLMYLLKSIAAKNCHFPFQFQYTLSYHSNWLLFPSPTRFSLTQGREIMPEKLPCMHREHYFGQKLAHMYWVHSTLYTKYTQ